MKEKTQKLLDDLIDQIDDEKQFRLVQDQLFKRGIESLLKAEMSALSLPITKFWLCSFLRNPYL